jgi:beta-ribofuranosylaminobenzene 5'-phosphate synthase
MRVPRAPAFRPQLPPFMTTDHRPRTMPTAVLVQAPSRLHFGLWSLASGSGRQFGGVGAMINRPGLVVRFEGASELAAVGPLAARAEEFARRWLAFHATLPEAAALRPRITIERAPPEHAGLGTGTQLGLAVAAGLCALAGLPRAAPQELAIAVGRGLRSAVGTYGFVHGGLVVDQGKLPGEPIAPLDCRLDLPAAWRFVLVRPTGLVGLSGDDEATAIADLPAVPPAVTERLIALVRERLVPAAALGDFAQFSECLFEYGRTAGECFAARQGGPFNGPVLTRLIHRLRELGCSGVGQSSWGPTLYALQPSEAAALSLAERLQATADLPQLEIEVAGPANAGAVIQSVQNP